MVVHTDKHTTGGGIGVHNDVLGTRSRVIAQDHGATRARLNVEQGSRRGRTDTDGTAIGIQTQMVIQRSLGQERPIGFHLNRPGVRRACHVTHGHRDVGTAHHKTTGCRRGFGPNRTVRRDSHDLRGAHKKFVGIPGRRAIPETIVAPKGKGSVGGITGPKDERRTYRSQPTHTGITGGVCMNHGLAIDME